MLSLVPPPVCSWSQGGPDVGWVRVVGELDLTTTPSLARMLSDAERLARIVVLDLRGVEFMDSSGVHTIVDASVRARAAGRRLVLVRGRPRVDRLFTLTGTAGQIEIIDIAPAEPAVQALLHLADRDDAS